MAAANAFKVLTPAKAQVITLSDEYHARVKIASLASDKMNATSKQVEAARAKLRLLQQQFDDAQVSLEVLITALEVDENNVVETDADRMRVRAALAKAVAEYDDLFIAVENDASPLAKTTISSMKLNHDEVFAEKKPVVAEPQKEDVMVFAKLLASALPEQKSVAAPVAVKTKAVDKTNFDPANPINALKCTLREYPKDDVRAFEYNERVLREEWAAIKDSQDVPFMGSYDKDTPAWLVPFMNVEAFVTPQGVFTSIDQCVHACKALLHGNAKTYALVMNSTSATGAAVLTRRMTGFNAAMWGAHRLSVYVHAYMNYFSQDVTAWLALDETKDRPIGFFEPEGGKDYDNTIGYSAADEGAGTSTQKWNLRSGKNVIGVAIMRVRANIRARFAENPNYLKQSLVEAVTLRARLAKTP